jgi:hypothetical protein
MADTTTASPISTLRLILGPAAVTLVVTLLRLFGELQQWSPRFFSRQPGGGLALVGIIWLVPIFGAYFAVRLYHGGHRPRSVPRALGIASLAFVVNVVLLGGAFALVKSAVGQLAVLTVTSWIAIVVARPAWPALWRVLLAYAVSARIPVLLIMFASIFGGLDTHYAKPRPDFPEMGPWGLFFWTALLPQGSIWFFLTIVGGLLFGSLAAFFVRTKN